MMPPELTCSLCSRPVALEEIRRGLAVLGTMGLECWRCLRDGVTPRMRLRKSVLDMEAA